MAHPPNHEKIGPTADIVAYWRGLVGIPFADQISRMAGAREAAEHLFKDNLPDLAPEQAVEVLEGLAPRGTVFVEGRYRASDREIGRTGFTNVYEIAAGISPRPIIRTADPNIIYVASDHPERLPANEALLRRVMERNGISRPNLYFSPVDVLDREALLAAAGRFGGGPIAFVHEGLLPYFDEDEKLVFGENVRHLLERVSGVWITPDIMLKEGIEARFGAMSVQERRIAELAIAAVTSGTCGRNVIDNAFASQSHVDRFFRELGFSVEKRILYDGGFVLNALDGLPEEMRERAPDFLRQNNIYVARLS